MPVTFWIERVGVRVNWGGGGRDQTGNLANVKIYFFAADRTDGWRSAAMRVEVSVL